MECKYCIVGDYNDHCYCQKQKAPNNICPHVRRCNKLLEWVALSYMKDCPMSKSGGNVVMEKRGNLYVDLGDKTVVVKNPYDYVPDNVKVRKYGDSYRIIKEKEKQE